MLFYALWAVLFAVFLTLGIILLFIDELTKCAVESARLFKELCGDTTQSADLAANAKR